MADNYEEIWEALPEQFRRKASGPIEERGARINTPPPTPPPTPGRRGQEERETQEEDMSNSEDTEESGEESAEEDEGRTKTTLQARVKKNGDIDLGYTKKMEGVERTEKTKINMSRIKKGPLGLPINIKETLRVKKEEVEEISRWRGAILGPSQNTYPEPKLHTLKGVIKNKRLDRITTHDLGKAIRNNSRTKVEPRCKEAWGDRFTLDLPWLSIGKEFARNIGTTRDTGSWFKNILHRALWLKGKGGARHKCSICADQESMENWDHMWQCPKLKPTWDKFIQLANMTMGAHHTGHSQACIYLGIDGSGESIQGTLGLL